MKPEDLLDALNGIPEEYISEAKPKRRKVSRRSLHTAEHTAADTVRTENAQIRRDGGSPASGALQGRAPKKLRRKETDMTQKQFSLHRLTTGIAAAAACAVFIGGGVFIAKQAADRNRTGGREENTNFLGGKGEIHVANSSEYPRRTLALMYDDTKVYFEGGRYAADRTGSGVLTAYMTGADVQATLAHTFWDGEQFYYADGNALYPMDMAGNRSAEPFYQIEWEPPADSPFTVDHIQFSDVVKLRKNDYWISYRMYNADESGEYAGSVWHHTGEDGGDFSDGVGAVLPGMILPEHPELSVWQTAANVLSCRTQNPDGTVSGSPLNMGPGSRNEMEYGTAWTLRGEDVYYMTEIYVDNIQFPHSSYAKINVLTEAYTEVCEKPEFDSFIPVGDSILTVSRDGRTLSVSDFELTKTDVLFEYGDSVPAEVQDAVSDAWNAAPLKKLTAADAQYALAALDTKEAAPQTYALFDRTASEMRYYQLIDRTAPEDNQQAPEAGRNFLGGFGEVHANDSQMCLMYDDTRLYFGGSLCADRTAAPLGRLTKTGFEQKELYKYCTDGECFYQQDGIHLYRTDNYGKPEEKPFFTVSEDDLETARNSFPDKSSIEEKVHAFRVQKVCEGYYVITIYLTEDPGPYSSGKTMRFEYLYQPDTGALTAMPEHSVPEMFWYSPEEEVLYAAADTNGELYRIPLDSSRQMTKIPMLSHGLKYCTCAAIDGGDFCYFSRVIRDGAQDGHLSYVRMNLETHAYEEIPAAPDIYDSVMLDGAVWQVSENGTLTKADMRLQNTETVWQPGGAVPDTVKLLSAEDSDRSAAKIYSIGEQYLAVEIPGSQFVLIDRKDNSVRYFSEEYTDADIFRTTRPAQELPQAIPDFPQTTRPASEMPQTAAQQMTGAAARNLFGGSGAVRPVDWDPHGRTYYFRDDKYFYLQETDADWLRWEIGKNTAQPEKVSPELDGRPYTGRLLSDGERVYTDSLAVVTGAGTEPFCFDMQDAFFGAKPVISGAPDLQIAADAVWHIRSGGLDSYFMVFSCDDSVNGSAENICTVWADADGKLLKAEHMTQEQALGAFFSDRECAHIFRYWAGSIAYIPMPGARDEADGGIGLSRLTAAQPGDITAAAVSDGCTYVLRENAGRESCTLWRIEADGSYEVLCDNAAGYQTPMLAPDGTVWYVLQKDEITIQLAVYDPDGGKTHIWETVFHHRPIHLGIAAEDTGYSVLIYMDENYESCPSFLDPAELLIS